MLVVMVIDVEREDGGNVRRWSEEIMESLEEAVACMPLDAVGADGQFELQAYMVSAYAPGRHDWPVSVGKSGTCTKCNGCNPIG